MDIQDKLNSAVKLAQSYILLFLKEYLTEEQLLNIRNLFDNCPVVLEQLDIETNEFGNTTNIGGNTQKDKIVIKINDIKNASINDEFELNRILGTIIHEYAHKIRSMNNQYGEMFEESFATVFAEICINNARLQLGNSQDDNQTFGMLNSVNYQKYESQLRAILYILKQNNLDKQLIVEYIAGNEEKFKQVCLQIFGEEFNDYYNSITSQNNENSEQILIDIIVKYIKEKGLNIKSYWDKDSNDLSKGNLYFKGSPTLCRSVVKVGIDNFTKEEQEFYRFYETSVKIANENDEFINQEKIDRVKQFIDTKFSLEGKSLEEIYDTVIELCSTYIQHKNRDDEESKIFIQEISKIIPDIDNFKAKFVALRVAGKDMNIFEGLNLENITYNDILSNMNKLLSVENMELDNQGGIKR